MIYNLIIHIPHLLVAPQSRGLISSHAPAESGFTRPGNSLPPGVGAPAAEGHRQSRPPSGKIATIVTATNFTVLLTHICDEESRLIVSAVRLHATFPGD